MTYKIEEVVNNSLPTCEGCKAREDKYYAIGLTIFVISLCSCGTLTLVAIPAGYVVMLVSMGKCKTCRTERKIRKAGKAMSSSE